MMTSLNLGCGNDNRCMVRMDLNSARIGINLIADAHFIPIRDKVIGTTLCKSVLEHVESPVRVIREMKRVTVNEIIIIVPNIVNIRRIIRGIRNPLHEMSSESRHLQGWDYKSIRHLALLTGLTIESFSWYRGTSNMFGHILRLLFSSHMVVRMRDV